MMDDAINSHSRRMYNAQKQTADLATPLDDPRIEIEQAFMEQVWSALKADPNDLRKQQRILKAFRAALSALEENK